MGSRWQKFHILRAFAKMYLYLSPLSSDHINAVSNALGYGTLTYQHSGVLLGMENEI